MDPKRDRGKPLYRIPVRLKGAAALWVPMAAVIVTLCWLNWMGVRLSKPAILAWGIAPPVVSLLVFLLGSRNMLRRMSAIKDNALRLANELPLEPFPPGTDEFAVLAHQLETAAGLMRERERDLRMSERRYRNLFHGAPVPYEETDCEGVVRQLNREASNLLKCGPDRILGSRAWDFVVPEQREEFRATLLDRVARAQEGDPFECEMLPNDGSRIVVEVRESLIQDENGDVTGVCLSLLDVTERKLAAVAARKVAQYATELRSKNEQLARAAEAARAATQAKTRFLASVSHELRTPLNAIIGFSEVLCDGKLGPLNQTHREVMGDILSSAQHLCGLITDILDLSEVEAGRMEFHPESSRLDLLVEEVRGVIRPLAARKQIRLSTQVPEGFTATLDRGRFKQVLYNYLSNAVKFTPNGGSIVVRVAPSGASFRLDVEDTGIGIAPDEIFNLFQDFQQPSGQTPEQGTGVGLALTRHIVEAQGGTVAVRSKPGAGSTFSALLPVGPRAASASHSGPES